MNSNSSSVSGEGSRNEYLEEADRAANAFYFTGIALAIVGTLLNVWFLVAVLTSREMRSRLRTKIMCNILLVLLLDSAFIIPSGVATSMRGGLLSCAFYSALINMQLMQEFVSNWLVVMILAVFIAQIQDFNPTSRLTPKAVTLSSIGLLVLPWVASLIVVPIIVHEYRDFESQTTAGCFRPAMHSLYVFKCIDTAVPIILAVVLLIIAAVLKYRRITRDHQSGSMQTELINRGPDIDNIFAYVAAVVVVVICDILRLIVLLNPMEFYKYDYITMMRLFITSHIMADARVVLMPISWILLPDVRQRIKTWPRPTPGNDVAVTYRKEEI